MFEQLLHGLASLGNFPAVGYLLIGVVIGVIFGVIPGLSGATLLSVMLVFVTDVSIVGMLCLFLGTLAASYYSASITSILLNSPAHPEAFAVTLDGFPMARRGEGGRALGMSATATSLGGLVGCAGLVGWLTIINSLPNIFHPPDYVALVVLALILVGTLGGHSLGKVIVSGGIGLLLSSVGVSLITGQYRYTFNTTGLENGLELVSVALGLFAVPQMVMMFGTGTSVALQDMTGRKVEAAGAVELKTGSHREVLRGAVEALRYWVFLIQGGITGVIVGVIPGIGGFAANFLSYGIAQKLSPRRKQFGTGIPEGIIAPESSSLAKEAGHMVPILGLGIPGGVGGALFIAALSLKDIRVGFGFTTAYPLVAYEIVWILALSAIIGTVIGVIAGPYLARITRVPGPLIVPFVLAASVIGPYLADVSYFVVIEVLAFAVVGLILRRLQYSVATFVIALVLGPTFENNLYLTHEVYPGFSFLGHRVLADVLLALAMVAVALKVRESRREARESELEMQRQFDDTADPTERIGLRQSFERARAPYPLLSLLVNFACIAFAVIAGVYAVSHFLFSTGLMPVVACITILAPCLIMLPLDIRRYVSHRRQNSEMTRLNSSALALTSVTIPVASVTDPSLRLTSASRGPLPASGAERWRLGRMHERANPPNEIRMGSWGRNGQYTRELIGFAFLTGLVLVCYVFGFPIGIGSFMVVYGLSCTGQYFQSRTRHLVFVAVSTAIFVTFAVEILQGLHEVFTPLISL